MSGRVTVLLVLVAAVVMSATAVVYSKHRTRTQFAQLQSLHRDRDHLNVQWQRLQLEQGAWTSHGRIERLAREKLEMKAPGREDMVLLSGVGLPDLDLGRGHVLAPPREENDGR